MSITLDILHTIMINKNEKYSKDEVFQILFDRIMNGGYAPGDRLTEQMFAEEFNLSRTPIREVLLQLATLRLVTLSPNKGAEVVGLSCDDVEEMYDIRDAMELLALESALPNIKLQELTYLKNKVKSIDKDSDLAQIAKVDHDLHSYIATCSNRPRLQAILNQLFTLIIRNSSFPFPQKQRLEQIRAEHLAIIDALFVRDEQKAKAVLHEHIHNSKVAALEFMFSKK